ncbi:hypothetical protein VQ056_20805 [Paenibacillus sp. JTLBN-2024]
MKRRDFTINAIARDIEGNVVDPFHGTNDLEARADPLRRRCQRTLSRGCAAWCAASGLPRCSDSTLPTTHLEKGCSRNGKTSAT